MQIPVGYIFNIQHFSINDGPGIRTTVFFKGCPLHCLWCSNPESQKMMPELIFNQNLCCRCYQCVEVCPQNANLILTDGSVNLDRTHCESCGKCVEVCPIGARAILGRELSLAEVIKEVMSDELFYNNSGGGITASGGEPTYQPEFLTMLFKECHNRGFHTILDTCGQVAWSVLSGILEHTDLVYYDLKHMDDAEHYRLTGTGNCQILENAVHVAAKNIPMVIRVPLIPGINDTVENILATSQFAYEMKIHRLDIIPFHQFGRMKYHSLGINYAFDEMTIYPEDKVDQIRQMYQANGLDVRIA
jgi:pyruvate formate lyase activating enzyme